MKNRWVIVRSRDAGVVFGKLKKRKGRRVKLTNSRQLWRWHARKGITLLDVARYGVKQSECKFSEQDGGPIEILDACAVLLATEAARVTIQGVSDLGIN